MTPPFPSDADRAVSLSDPPCDVTSPTPLLTAGGDDPERFDPLEAWYPVAFVADLDQGKPTAFTLLEKDLVIWWDRQASQWRVFGDRCPHRLARLSEGRINGQGLLECPYHGWAFAGQGDCQVIPQQEPEGTAHNSPRACARSYPATVAQGLLFVYPGTGDRAGKTPTPVISPMAEQPDGWVCIDTFRDLPYDAFTLLENVLDSSHLPFTHHRSVGNRANAAPVNLALAATGKQGFSGVWAEGPRRGKLGRQDTMFIAPNLMWHDLTSPQFGRTMTVVYATPIRPGQCRLFARFPFRFNSSLPKLIFGLTPRWWGHVGQNAILEDDQIFLHHQERYFADDGGVNHPAQTYFLPTRADLFVLELHRWLQKFQSHPFAGRDLSPALSRVQLLERYHSHTKHCASCRRALMWIGRSRVLLACLGFGSLAAGAGLELWALGAIAPAFSAFLWWQLGRFEQKFYRGEETPARNREPKR
ncbi:MAG: Rieske 2Fe-2S domain-containing protein [Oscillatoriales cyanobacterium SM2_2_1]|nr:Rieske 2Fe-2S domain-containing protein [Oscillatoriales cyanobacterium SM2_2_1]